MSLQIFLVHHNLPAFCASPKKNPAILLCPSHLTYLTVAFFRSCQPGLQDLLEEKDGSDVDAEAAALMLELRGSHERFVVGDGVPSLKLTVRP